MSQHVILVGEAPLTPALAVRAQAASVAALVHVLAPQAASEAVTFQTWASALAQAPHATAAIELVDTDVVLKRATLQTLDQALTPEALILTSNLAVAAAEAATWLRHPGRLVGLALLPPLTETSRAEVAAATDHSAALDAARILLGQLGFGVETVQDAAGGVLPRIVACLINEAAFALGEGVASAEAIDEAMRLGVAYPRGPLVWAREIGYSRVVAILDALHQETPDGRYRVAPWLRQQARRQQQVME
ncbi:MAG: 3-hydroxybutyryl-CoA dehydrogenase [Anaerolineae bacterium]|nr:3-hydroxybutyryl-CoA dehydrogenase [Anaerolineae bacterium]